MAINAFGVEHAVIAKADRADAADMARRTSGPAAAFRKPDTDLQRKADAILAPKPAAAAKKAGRFTRFTRR